MDYMKIISGVLAVLLIFLLTMYVMNKISPGVFWFSAAIIGFAAYIGIPAINKRRENRGV